MTTPRALVLRAAGTNCDAETAFGLQHCGAAADIQPLLPFLESPQVLRDYQILAIPGGFSYGDDIAAGRVFALELLEQAGDQILALVERGGLVLGICNGFQVLVQMGLLPGIEEPLGCIEVSLTTNERLTYEARWVHLCVETDRCAFLRKGERYYFPVGHAEGKLVPRDEQVLARMNQLGRVALRYVGAQGEAHPPWPANPNASTDAIAGLIDASGRILGLMPHPDRHLFPYQHPTWTRDGLAAEPDGLRLFRNVVRAVS